MKKNTPNEGGRHPIPAISEYGFIADCHSAALVSRGGSIDWCCMPRLDSESCFGRLLGWERGGYCLLAPSVEHETSRRYLENTLIIETVFRSEGGEARLVDFFPMREGGEHRPHHQIIRMVEGIRGRIPFFVEISPRFDYGAIKPWIRCARGYFTAVGGDAGFLISADFPLTLSRRHEISGGFEIGKNERARLSLMFRRPEELEEGLVEPPDAAEIDRRFEGTMGWWRSWSSKGKSIAGPYAEPVRRSAIVLKGLSNAPTGAIAAAATTSLPEVPGGSRNWDYRFSWIRDSCFSVRSLAELGYTAEADGFRRFIERSAAGSSDELQILFGPGGERRLQEYEIPELSGYRNSKPVRVGNAAKGQRQLDVYGELLELAWNWHRRGHSPDDDYWEFLEGLVDDAARLWREPDQGIWEMRGAPRHFVQSKAMCWVALDRGIRIAESTGRKSPLEAWKEARGDIRRTVEKEGYDAERGVFVQAFDTRDLDASLLLMPIFGFLDYHDDRMMRTLAAIREDLEVDGLLRRYPPGTDGLEGTEGTFLACTFWLAECLARQGRLEEAHMVFRRGLSAGNDLGLFSEEFEPAGSMMLGNFPQGLTHLSLIAAAVAIAEEEPKKERGQTPRS
jgi:GH15 family glucan-1,4-alpha-glucosidase